MAAESRDGSAVSRKSGDAAMTTIARADLDLMLADIDRYKAALERIAGDAEIESPASARLSEVAQEALDGDGR